MRHSLSPPPPSPLTYTYLAVDSSRPTALKSTRASSSVAIIARLLDAAWYQCSSRENIGSSCDSHTRPSPRVCGAPLSLISSSVSLVAQSAAAAAAWPFEGAATTERRAGFLVPVRVRVRYSYYVVPYQARSAVALLTALRRPDEVPYARTGPILRTGRTNSVSQWRINIVGFGTFHLFQILQ